MRRQSTKDPEFTATTPEINALFFKARAHEVNVQALHELTQQMYSEFMVKYNELSAELKAVKETPINPQLADKNKKNAEHEKRQQENAIKEQISELKTAYNNHFATLKINIIKTCNDTEAVKTWLRIALQCMKNGNDMIGYAIKIALDEPGLKNKVKEALPGLMELPEFLPLSNNNGYFHDFFSPQYYNGRLKRAENTSVPALPFYFTNEDLLNTIEDENLFVRSMKDVLTKQEWQIAARMVVGRPEESAKLELGKKFHLRDKKTIDDIYALVRKYDDVIRKFELVDKKYADAKAGLVPVNPVIAKFQAAINPRLAQLNIFFKGRAKEQVVAPVVVAEPIPEYIGPPEKSEKINLLTPKGMRIHYDKLIDKLGIDRNGKLKKEFRHNMRVIAEARIAEARIAHKHKHNNPFLRAGLVGDLLRDQQQEIDSIKHELKYAKRIHAALIELKNKNADPKALDQLAASFNHQVKRMAGNAHRIFESVLANEINKLIIPITKPQTPQASAAPEKDKENLRETTPAQETRKPSTADKRQYLTKKYSGLFNKPGSSSKDQSADKEKKVDVAENRKKPTK